MVRRERRVQCPQCQKAESVVPILYGPLSPQQRDQMMAGLIVMGGRLLYEDGRDPTHFCTECETSFRPLAQARGTVA
ncbi:MAG TPA: hypothetical protein PLP01_11695 [Phycisphaerae bacterium]|nr:hypothetical protein [Phycisphaerae bacterium]